MNTREHPGERWTGRPPALSHPGCCLRGGPGQVPLPLFLRSPFEAQGGLRPPSLGESGDHSKRPAQPCVKGGVSGGSGAVEGQAGSRLCGPCLWGTRESWILARQGLGSGQGGSSVQGASTQGLGSTGPGKPPVGPSVGGNQHGCPENGESKGPRIYGKPTTYA